MIVNILRFSFKDGTTADEQGEVLAALERLGTSDSVAFSVIGQDVGDPADGFTHAYCVAWKDMAALEDYMLREPAHVAADRAFLPCLGKLSLAGLADDLDPTLRERMGALHQQRMQDPELKALITSLADVSPNVLPR